MEDGISRARTASADIDGWLTDAEGQWLFEAARASRADIVEIGSWKGRSTVWLAHGSRQGACAPVHAIDPHLGSEEHRALIGPSGTFAEFRRNVARAGADELVRPIVALSSEAVQGWSAPIGLLFVDGSHAYEHVREDLRAWLPFVVEGGWVAVHDSSARPGVYWATGWEGPMRAVDETLLSGEGFAEVALIDTLTVARRVRGARLPRGRALALRARRRALQLEHHAVHRGGKLLPRWLRDAGRLAIQRLHR